MHDFLLLTAAVGFGALAWAMLAVSDWLLQEKEPTRERRYKSNAVRYRNEPADLAFHY